MRVEGEAAFVLHTRPYRESSQLVDLFTFNYGRIRAVSRGGRKSKSSPLTPFVQQNMTWGGRGDLKTLYGTETEGYPLVLQGTQLYTGLYLNELLVRTLPEQDAHQDVFYYYSRLLPSLASGQQVQPLLRQFEITLLKSLGYELVLSVAADSGEAVEAGRDYLYIPDLGLQSGFDRHMVHSGVLVKGEHLLAMERSDYECADVLRSAKHLLRAALLPLLGSKPMYSRELFRQSQQSVGT